MDCMFEKAFGNLGREGSGGHILCSAMRDAKQSKRMGKKKRKIIKALLWVINQPSGVVQFFWMLEPLKSLGRGNDTAMALFYHHYKAGWKMRWGKGPGGRWDIRSIDQTRLD